MRDLLVCNTSLATVAIMAVLLWDVRTPALSAQVAEMSQDADEAWSELMASGAELIRKDDETSLDFMLRQLETEKRRFRDRGFEFWSKFPNDPRRFEWLLITVHLQPDCTGNEDDCYRTDRQVAMPAARSEPPQSVPWDAVYPKLRSEFAASAMVTEEDRRFFQFGEILADVRKAIAQHAQGADVNPQPVLTGVAEFFNEYQQQFNVMDREVSLLLLEVLWRVVFESHSEELAITNRDALELLSTIEETDTIYAKKYNDVSRVEKMRAYLLEGNSLPKYTPRPFLENSDPKLIAFWQSVEKSETLADFKTYSSSTQFIKCYHNLVNARTSQERAYSLNESIFTDDHRRLLIRSIASSPAYYPLNPWTYIHECARNWGAISETDEVEWKQWLERYDTLSLAVLENDDLAPKMRASVKRGRIDKLLETLHVSARLGIENKNGVGQLRRGLREFYSAHGDVDYTAMLLSRISRSGVRSLGMSEEQVESILHEFAEYAEPDFSRVLETFNRRAALKETPFELRAQTMDGEAFDISDLRGQIVLVDHWNTGCVPCIEAMPGINETYEKYRDRGFVVVSLAYDGTSKRKRVLRIKEELELDEWISVNAESVREEMYQRYDIWTFPQYMLLDRDGTLYADTDQVNLGRNLSALLDEMLEKEAL